MTTTDQQTIPERLQRLRERLGEHHEHCQQEADKAHIHAVCESYASERDACTMLLALIDAQGPVICELDDAEFWWEARYAQDLLTALETAVDDLCGPAGRDGGMG